MKRSRLCPTWALIAVFSVKTCHRKARHLIETAGFNLVAGASNHQDLRLRVGHGAEAAGLAGLVLKIQVMAKVSDQLEKVLFRAAA
jgi:hypothetical protein